MTQPDDQGPSIIAVETERVEGVIDIVEIVQRLQENAVRSSAEARSGRAVDPDLERQLAQVSELAGQLAQALSALPPEALGREPGPPSAG